MLLRCTGDILRRRDAKVATFVFVEEPAEDGGRVEVGPGWRGQRGRGGGGGSLPAHEIETAVDADEGAGSHVAD